MLAAGCMCAHMHLIFSKHETHQDPQLINFPGLSRKLHACADTVSVHLHQVSQGSMQANFVAFWLQHGKLATCMLELKLLSHTDLHDSPDSMSLSTEDALGKPHSGDLHRYHLEVTASSTAMRNLGQQQASQASALAGPIGPTRPAWICAVHILVQNTMCTAKMPSAAMMTRVALYG